MAQHRSDRSAAAARLALRGSAGRLWTDLHRPVDAGAAVLVYLRDPVEPILDPSALSRYAGLAVLAVRTTDTQDAVAVTEWAAAHVVELDADPGRLLVGGERRGAALAAAVARHAREEGWPPLLRQVLVAPSVPAEAVEPPPATVVGADSASDPELAVRLGAALRRHTATIH